VPSTTPSQKWYQEGFALFPLATLLDPGNSFTMVVFLLDDATLVDHPFVLFLRSKCYRMVESEFFCLCVTMVRRVG
jgi:hypothetical protein